MVKIQLDFANLKKVQLSMLELRRRRNDDCFSYVVSSLLLFTAAALTNVVVPSSLSLPLIETVTTRAHSVQ